MSCTQPVADRLCGATPTRPYLSGPRCPAHSPAALAGQPEPPSTPLRALAVVR